MERKKITGKYLESIIERGDIDQGYINAKSKSIIIRNLIVIDEFELPEFGDRSFHISNCEFEDGILITGASQQKTILFESCTLHDLTVIEKNVGLLSLKNCEIRSQVNIINCEVQSLFIKEADGGKFIFEFSKFGTINIEGDGNASINEIILSEIESNYLNISKYNIGIVNLIGTIKNGNRFNFRYLKCSILQIQNVFNEGVLQFSHIASYIETGKSNSNIQISNSNLSKAEFYSVDFSSFRIIIATESVITECIFVNTKWPAQFLGEKDTLNKREVYRQIKYALGKQGNNYDEQKFHALELNTLYNTLSYRNEFWTKLILRLSQLTSNYGLSILRPILFILFANSILLWIFFYLDMQQITIASKLSSGNLVDAIGVFFHYSNPVHKFEESLTGWQIVIDSFMRIFSSYAIYNFIRASRRFIK